MKKILLFVFLFFLLVPATKAADTTSKEDEKVVWPRNRIGLTASTFTGYGLTYYRYFGSKFTWKICVFAYGNNNGNDENLSDEFQSIVGTDFQYTLHQTKYTRFHLFASFSYWYYDEKYSYAFGQTENENINVERTYSPGIGFGFEFLAWKRVSFNLETGIQAKFHVNSDYSSIPATTYPKSYGFGIGGGITYAF